MLSLLAITADSNACRHPTIEVINPLPLIRFPAVSPVSPEPGSFRHYVSTLIASNSQ
jgi:hypothetical protein